MVLNPYPEGDDTAKDEVEKSWRMNKDPDNHANQLGHESQDVQWDLNDIHNQNAGSLKHQGAKKQGADPKSFVLNTANFIDVKIKSGELSDVKIYVIIDFKDTNYVITLRYVISLKFQGFNSIIEL